jgi:predicted dehydrogenase
MVDVQILWWRSGKGVHPQDFDEEMGVTIFANLNQAIERRPDFAIISNPTAFHVETAITLADVGIPFLIEKPVSDRLDGLDKLRSIIKKKSLPVLVGFQLRYHPGYQRLLELLKEGVIGRTLGFHGYVGQYLPNWRENTPYQQSYSSKKDLGGGVIFDLCHEIDIAISVLGKATTVSCFCDHFSDLKIETEDIAEITTEHQDKKLSHIHLNYLERRYEWVSRVLGTSGTVIWDYGRGYVEVIGADGTSRRWEDPNGFERDWLFRDQLKHWLNVLEGKASPLVNLDDGIAVTRVTLAAKRSAEEKRPIRL